MSRAPRDRDAERRAIRAAMDRLLAGTPLRSATGKLTATELITESGLRRDVVYEHGDLVEEFKAQAKTQHTVPTAMRDLAEKHQAVALELAETKAALARERATSSALRKAVAELSLELDQVRAELAGTSNVARFPVPANRTRHGD
jgi:hypothetical protein